MCTPWAFLTHISGHRISRVRFHSPNNTLFTWEDNDLPIGTYIATGVSGIPELAEYLADRTEVGIIHLLISDSTIEDVGTRHGYHTMSLFEYDEGEVVIKRKTDPRGEGRSAGRSESYRTNRAQTTIGGVQTSPESLCISKAKSFAPELEGIDTDCL